jgi:predicted secreted protein
VTRRALFGFAAALMLLGVACSDDDSSSSDTTATTAGTTKVDCPDCEEFGEGDTSIDVAAGEQFAIELESNQTTGYQWTATSSDETVVREESSQYIGPTTKAIGAGGTQRFVFAAERVGTATLTLLYSRSFEDGADAREVAYTVTVS